jgi:hypothetical protein
MFGALVGLALLCGAVLWLLVEIVMVMFRSGKEDS